MDFAAQVKASVDIVKTIGEYVRLKKAGAGGRYTGLCPFHSEKTPSFSVHGGHQFFYCFGCQAKGDVFSFLMQIEGLEFSAALKLLAERNGIPVPKRTQSSSREEQLRASLAEMHSIAEQLYRENLTGGAGAEARAYLERRGVTTAQAERFGLGLSDAGGQQLIRRLERHGFPQEFLEASGLVRARTEGGFYDYFRGRLMFPIHSESGETIAFGGRALRDGDQPKYLNSPETTLYRKSATLYNLHRARTAIRKHDRAVLVEGYMDVIGVSAAGVEEVVASCGTALTPAQSRAVRRHAERIVVNFDPDAAGTKAAERSIDLLIEEGLRVRVLALDGDLDPDEYVKKEGAEAYRAKLDDAPAYFHWLFDRARARYGSATMDERLEGWKFVFPSIQRIPDRIERIAVAGDAADFLGIERSLVLDQLRRAQRGAAERPARDRTEAAAPPLERLLLAALLASEVARAEAIPPLRETGLLNGLKLRPVFEAVLAACEGEFSYDAVEGRLDEANRTLLAALCLTDEGIGAEAALEQALECVRGLQQQDANVQRSALKTQIRELTRSGDMIEAMKLAGRLSELEKSADRAMRTAVGGPRHE